MDHNGNSDLLTSAKFPTSKPSFFFVFVPTVLLEERARTFQDALDILYEDQSAAECQILRGSREGLNERMQFIKRVKHKDAIYKIFLQNLYR